jgi:dTDP-4-amino-4,6-dideoxygalactose transaminase
MFSPPDISDDEIKAVTETLKSGWITTGPKTKLFEEKITAYCRTSKTVCLNSATAAMEMTLRLLGIGPGDEVITSAYTYTASASVICHVGATPVLVDVAKDSYEMDYEQLEKAINAKTKAVIPVDIGGKICDYQTVFDIVNKKRNLFCPKTELQKEIGRIAVISDCAHGFGATYQGRKSGNFADFTCFSFHAVKNLTTAEGGAVTWNDIDGADNDQLYKEFMLLSLHGQSKDALAKTRLGAWEYDIISTSYKCNMTDIMAAIGLVQLNRYEDILRRRKGIISRYDEGFGLLDVNILKHVGEDFSSNGHLYMLRLNHRDRNYRDDFITKMANEGIATNVHYKPLPMHTAYKKMGFDIKDYPNSFEVFANEITLPLNTKMTDDDVDYVIDVFNRLYRE